MAETATRKPEFEYSTTWALKVLTLEQTAWVQIWAPSPTSSVCDLELLPDLLFPHLQKEDDFVPAVVSRG